MKVKSLYSYFLKSAKGKAQEIATIEPTGFLNDRSLAIIDNKNNIITGRQSPKLVMVSADIDEGMLHLNAFGRQSLETVLQENSLKKIKVRLFRHTVDGFPLEDKASQWISDYLGESVRLVSLNKNFREIDPKRGGLAGELVGYADAAPIHLISKASLKVLEKTIGRPWDEKRFRPNIVIDGNIPFEEETWENVTIGQCSFRAQFPCKRCVFTTVDPETGLLDEQAQPLSGLSRLRRERNEDIVFGIYLVPSQLGQIKLGETVIAENKSSKE